MAISPEQHAMFEKTIHQEAPKKVVANWPFGDVPAYVEKEWEYLCCSATHTIASFGPKFDKGADETDKELARNKAVRQALDFLDDNPGLTLVPYQPGTEAEKRHVKETKVEQGWNYFEDNGF